jgi:predicted ArsR family transcriptional regulator
MRLPQFGARFMEGTRGRIVSLLRRGARTVEELAQGVELTDNAVRAQLTSLERDGLVRQEGVRRGPGAGKPAVLYQLHPDAEPLFSAAYPSVLTELLDALGDELPRARYDALLKNVGRRLATGAGGEARGTLKERVRAAAAILSALGAEVDVKAEKGALVIQGHGCPLSAAVTRRPETCRAVQTLVSEIAGAPAQLCCEHGERPRCCFKIDSAA